MTIANDIHVGIKSDSMLDVYVERYELRDDPASLEFDINVAGRTFSAKITYHSISSWRDVWRKCSGCEAQVLGALVAWDCMRFLALGGERLILCKGLEVSAQTASEWRYCFLKQFGEWRYRNNFEYSRSDLPALITSTDHIELPPAPKELSSSKDSTTGSWLLTNGGGKDTVVGIALLKRAGIAFELYEGVLPTGGSHELQRKLLAKLRESIDEGATQSVQVSISDSFYDTPNERFTDMGVKVSHYKCDFAVGHTANYIGYFPLILSKSYSAVAFNIEASSERTMMRWGAEDINHQWCKSIEYRKLAEGLFRRITGDTSFIGFVSTIGGLSDMAIYRIACAYEDRLRLSHSCNISKPWCRSCPKCCYSFLMMAAFKGEDFAQEVMGCEASLFDRPDIASHWHDLLDRDRVAWECVPSHCECLRAVVLCLERGIRSDLLEKYRNEAMLTTEKPENEIDWPAVSKKLLISVLEEYCGTGAVATTDVVVVGAGHSGLSASYLMKTKRIDHLVLDSGSIGNSWRQRWKSFRVNTPNSMFRLPGFHYNGSEGFCSGLEVARRLEEYAGVNNLPTVCGCRVERVEKTALKFVVYTSKGVIETKAVVVASGEYAIPRLPTALRTPIKDVSVLHSRDYNSPEELCAGPVLVVGGGQSGAQIVEDILRVGRKVYWALSGRPSNVRRLYGKDFMEWWEIGGILHRHVSDIPDVKDGKEGALERARSMEFPLVSGIGEGEQGKSISLKDLEESGVTLLGKLITIRGTKAEFEDSTVEIDKAVSGTRLEFEMLAGFARKYYSEMGEPLPDVGGFVPAELVTKWVPLKGPRFIDLQEAGINSIVAATGYQSQFKWLSIQDILDNTGYPVGWDGISPCEGLYFLGLFNLQRLSSTCLCNEGLDAETILPQLLAHIGPREIRVRAATVEVSKHPISDTLTV